MKSGAAWPKAAKERGPEALPVKFKKIRSQILHSGQASLKILLSRFVCIGWATPNYARSMRYAMALVSGAYRHGRHAQSTKKWRDKNSDPTGLSGPMHKEDGARFDYFTDRFHERTKQTNELETQRTLM